VKIRFYREALYDWLKSISYYSEIDVSLADFFCEEISKNLSQLKQFPKIGQKHKTNSKLRVKVCKSFPYSIIYHVVDNSETIFIVAIAHNMRNPDYWKSRGF